MILLDTNILIVSKQSGHPDFIRVTTRLTQLAEAQEDLVICPQNLYEFFVAGTRPVTVRGLGLTKERALQEIRELKNTYTFINDPENLYNCWLHITTTYDVAGKQGHDARIVAFMNGTGITRLYTLNVQDFNRYNDIITLII